MRKLPPPSGDRPRHELLDLEDGVLHSHGGRGVSLDVVVERPLQLAVQLKVRGILFLGRRDRLLHRLHENLWLQAVDVLEDVVEDDWALLEGFNRGNDGPASTSNFFCQ